MMSYFSLANFKNLYLLIVCDVNFLAILLLGAWIDVEFPRWVH